MKANIPDAQRPLKQVDLWTPWGVLRIAGDEDRAVKPQRRPVERRLPVLVKTVPNWPDLRPRA